MGFLLLGFTFLYGLYNNLCVKVVAIYINSI